MVFLKFFAKITGKHLCQSIIFNKVVGLRATDSEFNHMSEYERNIPQTDTEVK